MTVPIPALPGVPKQNDSLEDRLRRLEGELDEMRRKLGYTDVSIGAEGVRVTGGGAIEARDGDASVGIYGSSAQNAAFVQWSSDASGKDFIAVAQGDVDTNEPLLFMGAYDYAKGTWDGGRVILTQGSSYLSAQTAEGTGDAFVRCIDTGRIMMRGKLTHDSDPTDMLTYTLWNDVSAANAVTTLAWGHSIEGEFMLLPSVVGAGVTGWAVRSVTPSSCQLYVSGSGTCTVRALRIRTVV